MSDFQSNLECPDLRPHFPHMRWWSESRAFGHEVGSDMDFDPDCWSLTQDEAAILYHCGMRLNKGNRQRMLRPNWLVIGARLGWCSMHLAESGCMVTALDPELAVLEFGDRFEDNTDRHGDRIGTLAMTSDQYFRSIQHGVAWFRGFFVDGNHDAPCPLNDAMNCAKHAPPTAVLVFHDAHGAPIREGALWLMDHGWHARWMNTPNGMIVCWRGDFRPPDHIPDPAVDWAQVRRQRASGFPFERCE